MSLADLFHQLVGDEQSFTINSYQRLATELSQNFVFSPLSVNLIISLIRLGTKNETSDEIRDALGHLSPDKENLQCVLMDIISFLVSEEQYHLEIVNTLYLQESFIVKEKFKELFEAFLESSKFYAIIDKRQNFRSFAVLNKVLFQAKWVTPFDSFSEGVFYKNENDLICVETMTCTSYYNYYEYEELDSKCIELQLNGEASLIVILPNKILGMIDIENRIQMILKEPVFKKEYITIVLPKFSVKTAFDYQTIFKEVGVLRVFDRNQADFTEIFENANVYLEAIHHESFINVTEGGVDVAKDLHLPRCEFFSTSPPKQFIVDHPFIFYIKIKGVIIFVGRILTPL